MPVVELSVPGCGARGRKRTRVDGWQRATQGCGTAGKESSSWRGLCSPPVPNRPRGDEWRRPPIERRGARMNASFCQKLWLDGGRRHEVAGLPHPRASHLHCSAATAEGHHTKRQREGRQAQTRCPPSTSPGAHLTSRLQPFFSRRERDFTTW